MHYLIMFVNFPYYLHYALKAYSAYYPFDWLLVSEPGKSGLGGILDTFWYGTEDFGETGPEMEIPGSDLAFGRCQV